MGGDGWGFGGNAPNKLWPGPKARGVSLQTPHAVGTAKSLCPKKIKNLEVAMSLSNHSTYQEFCVSPSSFLLSVPELNIIFIIEQHKEIHHDGRSQFQDTLVLSRLG